MHSGTSLIAASGLLFADRDAFAKKRIALIVRLKSFGSSRAHHLECIDVDKLARLLLY